MGYKKIRVNLPTELSRFKNENRSYWLEQSRINIMQKILGLVECKKRNKTTYLEGSQ